MDPKQERLVYSFALLICVVGMLFFWNRSSSLQFQLSEAISERERLQLSLDSLKNADIELLPVTRFRPLSERQWRNLVNLGLAQPEAELRADLMKNGHLIAMEGVLGGTPGFYNPEGIHLLNDRWVYAEFEDGHVMGHMILEYRVSRGGEINWNVVIQNVE